MKDFVPFVFIGLTAGSVYGMAGTGLVLTYKTSGIFNFAHGTIAALVAYAFYDLRQRQGLPWPVALFVCLFVLSPLAGLVLERVARRLADAPVAMKVVATAPRPGVRMPSLPLAGRIVGEATNESPFDTMGAYRSDGGDAAKKSFRW
jgi:hypothetical protein